MVRSESLAGAVSDFDMSSSRRLISKPDDRLRLFASFLNVLETKDLRIFNRWPFPLTVYMYGLLGCGLVVPKTPPEEMMLLITEQLFEHIKSSRKIRNNIPAMGQFFLAVTDCSIGDFGGMKQFGLKMAERLRRNKWSFFAFGATIPSFGFIRKIYRKASYNVPKPDIVYLYLKDWNKNNVSALIKWLSSSTFLIPDLDEITHKIAKNYQNTVLIDPVLPDTVEVSTYLFENRPELFGVEEQWSNDRIYHADPESVNILHKNILDNFAHGFADGGYVTFSVHRLFVDVHNGVKELRDGTLGEVLL